MASLGFVKVYNLLGGIVAWNTENYITTSSKESTIVKSPNFTNAEIENIFKNNELVLIDFSTEWCVPCKKMKPVIQEIQKENLNVKVIHIDADDHQELIKKYQIKGVPVFMVFKNGKEIFKHVGIISKEALLKQLN